jgi:tryptophan-rich sensory protein
MHSNDSVNNLTGSRDPRGARSPFSRWLALAAFLILTLGGGTLIGMATLPGDWYAALEKPFFNPPNWLFGPVWTILYILVGIAGWRTWLRGYRGVPMQVWFGQLVFNFLWSPIFFGVHQIGFAVIIIASMIGLTVLFVRLTWDHDRASALLMLPYLAWISFAGLLNGSLWWLN